MLLWLLFEPERLPAPVRQGLEDLQNRWTVSQVSTWEIQIKWDLGKLPLPEPPESCLPRLIAESGLAYQPLQDAAIFMLGKLPPLHRDPFDRLLVATAIINGLCVCSSNPQVTRYPVRVLN